MESSKNNIENFERFLRDKTDEFRMYPSKRVWYSIYNNMHPGNRMPSLSMSIVLICSLFLIGYLNTDVSKQHTLIAGSDNENKITDVVIASVHTSSVPSAQINTIDFGSQQYAIPKTTDIAQPVINTGSKAASGNTAKAVNHSRASFTINTSSATTDFVNNNNIVKQENATTIIDNNVERTNTNENTSSLIVVKTESSNSIVFTPEEEITKNMVSVGNEKTASSTTLQNGLNTNDAVASSSIESKNLLSESVNANDTKTEQENKKSADISKNSLVSNTLDKAWVDDFVLHNKPVAKKWAGRLSWTAYITPSVVYRHLRNNAPDKLITGNSDYNSADVDKLVKHKPSFGAEAGFGLLYDVKKNLRLKASVQFDYSRYNAHAYENHHPIGTSILLNNDNNSGVYESFRSSPYSNSVGLTAVKLHNESYQLSLPFGADIKLISLNDKINWYAGATIQPTFVLYGKSYIVSSDRRSYVTDKSLLNKFNLNAGFETYLSFNTDNYTWQVGPQFRSQIFSTNTKVYTVEERLMNFGFKIGISKRL